MIATTLQNFREYSRTSENLLKLSRNIDNSINAVALSPSAQFSSSCPSGYISKMASRDCKHPIYQDRPKKYSVEASSKLYDAYKAYFGMSVSNQDTPCEHLQKSWMVRWAIIIDTGLDGHSYKSLNVVTLQFLKIFNFLNKYNHIWNMLRQCLTHKSWVKYVHFVMTTIVFCPFDGTGGIESHGVCCPKNLARIKWPLKQNIHV